ncbi:MAG TPA: helix-turn-helix domain-containing protein [Acidimicrobiales bacterium]|nr:helix-turn-helix domain-containing protein [Acidimicrobiales bacterium]
MVRLPPVDRLRAVAEAATRVFGRQGYRGTRTADVAAAAGMSSGSLFTYVESKEALFYLVFAHGFGLFADGIPPLPLATPEPGATVELIAQKLRRAPAPRLRAALGEARPGDVRAELVAIVEERYDLITDLWPLLAVIERCAVDLPQLDALYFGRVRRANFDQLARYLEMRSGEGLIRQVDEPEITARIIVETVSWFSWKRHGDRDAAMYDEEATRRTVTEFVCTSLLGST